MTDTEPQWIRAHGADYAVPDVIAKAEGIEDTSWKNDACPSFGRDLAEDGEPYAHMLRIYTDHPDPYLREGGDEGDRYLVIYHCQVEGMLHPEADFVYTDTACITTTNDPEEAMRAFMKALLSMQDELRARKAR